MRLLGSGGARQQRAYRWVGGAGLGETALGHNYSIYQRYLTLLSLCRIWAERKERCLERAIAIVSRPAEPGSSESKVRW